MNHFLANVTEILLLAFLLITYLQSGLDKMLDWTGNTTWLKEHFAKSALGKAIPFLLSIILITEIIASVLCAIGIFQLGYTGVSSLAFYGGILSCVILLMLLFGQRMAKDYEGAKTIAVYFIPSIFLVFLLQA